jgi:sugar phosphate isomerase/epimerase
MKLGIFANAFAALPLREALKTIRHLGIDMVEFSSGEEAGNPHIDSAELLANPEKLRETMQMFKYYELGISAISCHGNPVSPRTEVRVLSQRKIKDAILLAEKMGVDRIITFSGCPGDCDGATYSDWVTTGWPQDFSDVLKWQWEKKLTPYWNEIVPFARDHGVEKIALELHPGFCCYNPKTLHMLRGYVGNTIGANLDFSHLLWQRMDPILVIRELGDAIYHMHAKDISMDEEAVRLHGYISTNDYIYPKERSFNFRVVGYGQDMMFWKNVYAELRKCGYDYVSSIELECEMLDGMYGAQKAVEFLKECMLFDQAGSGDKWLDIIQEPNPEQDARYGVGKTAKQ